MLTGGQRPSSPMTVLSIKSPCLLVSSSRKKRLPEKKHKKLMLKVMLQQMMVNLNLSWLVLHRQSARHLVAFGIEKHHPSAELFITFSSTVDETLLVRK